MKRSLVTCLLVLITILSWSQERIVINHGPYLQNLRETEVTIVWTSSLPSVGWVELAPNDDSNFYNKQRSQYFDVINGVKNTSTIHTVKIEGLQPGTTYRYRVYSKEVLSHKWVEVVYGKTTATDVFGEKPLVFTTNDSKKSTTSFAMINDIHGRTADIPTLLNVADYKNLDMVIFNGDMLSALNDEESLFTGFVDVSVKLFARERPMYYARGNHETRGLFATSFQKYFSPQEPHLYYMVRQGPACFIFLDSGEDKPDSDIEYYGITDYDNYRTQQAAWLKEAVRSKEYTDAKYRIIVCHMPPVDVEPLWHGQQEVLEKFVPILNKSNATVMICGHLHRFLYHDADSKIHFPIVVNSLDTVLKGTIEGKTLTIEVKDKAGNTIDTKNYSGK